MAILSWTNFSNGDTLGVIRGIINSFNTNVTAQVNTNTTAISTNTTAITAIQNEVPSAVSISSMAQAPQTLVANVAEKLEWMGTAVVDSGGTDIEYTLATDNVLIKTAGVYEVGGVITLTAPINDVIDIELYIDNLPTGFIFSAIGRGTNSSVTFPSSFMTSFAVNDDITLYVKSTGTTITLKSASFSMVKTKY